MLKHFILVTILVMAMPAVLSAQINWTEHVIDSTFDGAYSVYAFDLDDDGDVDVLGTANVADDITWWENDGNENFTEHVIDSTFDGAYSVYALDLDDDGDVDVLGAAYTADDITWWENDGNENFTEHTIAGTFDGAASVYAIDVEPDGDVDVLGAAGVADDITWWENDGNENFTEHTIAGTFDGAWSVYALDLDDDGDVDVLGAAWGVDDITWWENDGSENFTEHTIAGAFNGAISVYAIDVEPDGDVDVLGTAYVADDITWWENDGSENFTEHTIAGAFDGAWSVYALDVDNDNDVDVLGAAREGDAITWWENDGSENFTEHTIAGGLDWAMFVYAVDLDDDNDVDVLGAAQSADDIIWWESDLVGGTDDVGTISIDIPSTLPADTTLSPQATVKNFGTDPNSFDVTCEIEPGGYTSFETVTSLASGDSTQVTFSPDFTFVGGSYTVTVYTQLAGDINPANDTLTKIIEASSTDVSTVSIDIPSSVPENTTLSPQATVKNEGTDTETFDVTCEIEPGGYTSFETVTDLASGDSIQVTFTPDFDFVSGSYTVTVYTELAGDDNPANDTLEKVIQTYDPGIAEEGVDTPETFSFSAPTFSKSKTHIDLALPVSTKVDLLVYDAIGRLSETLISKKLSAGNHSLNVNLNLPTGVYFYNLKTESGEDVIKKFLLVR